MNLLAFAMIAAAAQPISDSHATAARAESNMARTVTSEEIRLAERGQSGIHFDSGVNYRFVGRVRVIGVTETGLPKITFTGIEAVLRADFDHQLVESLAPDTFIALECRLSSSRVGPFIRLENCSNPDTVQAVSAEDYRTAYDRNPFRADTRFKDKEVVIHGIVRLRSRLNDGSDYISFTTEGGFSDVVAILNPASRRLESDYARVGQVAVLYCEGGARWNLAGSIGLRNCRFLEND
jgi:hypothetical protein